MLSLAGLELEPLQVVDVAVGDEETAHAPVGRAVRVVVDADPDRRAACRDELALEAGAFALDRRLGVRVVERPHVAAQHLGHLAPHHLVGTPREPVQERPVGEAVPEAAIDVGDREAERVQLALRQRLQVAALDGVAHRLDGGNVGTERQSLEGHES